LPDFWIKTYLKMFSRKVQKK